MFNNELFEDLRLLFQPFKKLEERLEEYRQRRIETIKKSIHNQKSNYIIAKAIVSQTKGEEPFILDEAVKPFLLNEEINPTKCFLLQGDPGSGKSYYSKILEETCLDGKDYFPVWVSVKINKEQRLKQALLNIGFTEKEFLELEKKLKLTKNSTEIIQSVFGTLY